MKIIARMLEDEVYEAHNEAGHKIIMDMREASLKQNQSHLYNRYAGYSCFANRVHKLFQFCSQFLHQYKNGLF